MSITNTNSYVTLPTSLYLSSNSEDNSALILAANSGDLDAVKSLLATHGTNVNLADNRGNTALHYAANWRHLDRYCPRNDPDTVSKIVRLNIVKALIEAPKIDVNAINEGGETALHYAAEGGHLDIVEALLATGKINIDAVDHEYGKTALAIASMFGNLDIVKALIATGKADVNSIMNNGTPIFVNTAGRIYYGRNNLEILKALIATGNIDVNTTDIWGNTALHLSANSGFLDEVEFLLSVDKIDPNLETIYGKTALDLALEGNHHLGLEGDHQDVLDLLTCKK